jgi:hypothetical protein
MSLNSATFGTATRRLAQLCPDGRPHGKLTERQAWGTAVRIASVIHALAAVMDAVTA